MRWREVATPALGLLIGVGAGSVVAAAAQRHELVGVGVAAALVLVPLLVLRPDWGTLLFYLSIILIEEFPTGQGETVDRSIRTPYYAKSIGVSGLFATDIFIVGLLVVFVLQAIIKRRHSIVPSDRYTYGLAVMAVMIALAVALSFSFGNPLAEGEARTTSGALFLINDRALRLIAFFQVKLYGYLFASYLLGLFFLDSPARLRQLVQALAFAAIAEIAIGAFYLARSPGLIARADPLFYHWPTSWMFATMIFYIVLRIAGSSVGRAEAPASYPGAWAVVAGVLAFYILISFRRTMWGGIGLASLGLFYYLPARQRLRFAALASLGLVVALVLFLSPLADSLRESVAHRVSETGVHDRSTAYRIAVAAWVAENWREIPLMGWGAMPLWNKVVRIGIIPTNIENVHSLYFWLLFRTGPIGLAFSLGALAYMNAGVLRLSLSARDPLFRRVAIAVLLALFVFHFSGVFNPAYAEVRCLVFVGLCFALASRIRTWEQEGKFAV